MSIANDRVSIYIFMVFGIFLVLLGTLGNILSLCVLNRSALRRLKIRPYLIALAVFDLLVLYVTFLPALIIISHGSQGKQRTAIQCKLTIYFAFLIIDCSSWITVAITVERLLYVIRPHMVRPQRGTAIALSLTIGLVAIINIPIALGWTSVDGKCAVAQVYYLIHFIVCSYIPAAIMVPSNIFITYTLCRRPKLGSGASTQRDNTIRIAMAINLVFLCTAFPVSIVWVIVERLYLPLYLLHYSNYAINFVMYIIAGQMFREELKAMFSSVKSVCCQKSDTYPISVNATASATASTTDTSV